MAKWFENNMSAVREYPFDFERYMEQRLREIDNLDERRFMKEILLQGLGSAVQFMEEKYRKRTWIWIRKSWQRPCRRRAVSSGGRFSLKGMTGARGLLRKPAVLQAYRAGRRRCSA